MPKPRTLEQHLASDGGPKRILALDGGGLRGIVTLAFLDDIEALLRARHGGDPDFRLSHYFDLIAGTSTGAIIAAALATGMSVQELTKIYLSLGRAVFEKSLFRLGFLRAKYDEARLESELQQVLGKGTTLGAKKLETGVLLVTKRLDTGSTWPLSNNPRGRYHESSRKGVLANKDYALWQVVRASTAAPTYFVPQKLEIGAGQTGLFVDGGVSPHNNPALQAFWYATLDGHRLGWRAGADRLLLVSIGTGRRDPSVKPIGIIAGDALQALASLMDDCADLVEQVMQWMSASPTARIIDREVQDLQHDLIGGAPQLTYLRYNVSLSKELSAMDDPKNMAKLKTIGDQAAKTDVRDADFPIGFDVR